MLTFFTLHACVHAYFLSLSLSLSLSLTLIQVTEKLVGMGVDGDLSQLVAGCLWVRREEISSQLLRDSYKFSHTYFNDFDWRLKVCVCVCVCVCARACVCVCVFIGILPTTGREWVIIK